MTQVQALVEAYDTFITGCKSDGTWDAIKASCIMAGWDGLAGALTPLKGTAPTNINFSGAEDSSWNSVSLLLRGEGPDNSTTFTDSSPNPLTPTINASTVLDILAASGKFGSGIKYTNTGVTNAYVRYSNPAALQFGTGDFTWECWIRPDAAPAAGFYNVLWDSRAPGEALTNRLYIDFYPNGGSTFQCFANGVLIASTTNLSVGVWYHVAVCRASGTTRLFVNGTEEASTADTANYTNGTNRPVFFNNLNENMRGVSYSVDEYRVTKGVARYTSNFTPSTLAFPGSLQSDYNRTTGLVGDGNTKYLNTNRTVTADPQNNCHISAYVTSVTTGSAVSLGSPGLTNTGASVLAHVNPIQGRLRCTTYKTGTINAAPPSFAGFSRSSSLGFVARSNGSSETITQSSAAYTFSDSYTSHRFQDFYYSSRITFYSIGESLNLALLDSRVATLMADIAAAIP